MTTIALVGSKGGAGKTTLAINLASVLDRRASAAILDADPQGSSLQWRAIADDEGILPVFDAASDLSDLVQASRGDYRYLVIDCPPSVDAPQTHEALRISDLVLVPVQPSPLDLWATVHIDNAIAEARQVNPELRALLVINQLEPRTRLSRQVRLGADELGLPAAGTAIRRRALYRTSVLEGRSVVAVGRQGAAAVEELEQLINEVITS